MAFPFRILAEGEPSPRLPLLRLLVGSCRSPATAKAYERDLLAFARFMGCTGDDIADDLDTFATWTRGEIARVVAEYRAALMAQGLAAATINRRLSAISALLRLAYRLEVSQTDGRNLMQRLPAKPYRDTRGPDRDAARRLLAAPDASTRAGLRDRAALALLLGLGLRAAELCALDVSDFMGERIRVIGKGSGGVPVLLDVPPGVAALVVPWAEMLPAGPLFVSLDHRPDKAGKRLSTNGLRYILDKHKEAAGIKRLTPHMLRHAAITLALEATGGNVAAVASFSRHKDVRTVQVYNDAAASAQGSTARAVGDLLL